MTVLFRLLGPLTVEVDGRPVPIGGRKQRTALAVLLLNVGRLVPADQLIDALWGEEAPLRAGATLQVHVSNLRKALVPVAERLGRPAIAGEGGGYRLDVDPALTDVGAFERAVAAGNAALASGDPQEAARSLRAALDAYHGPPLGELGAEPWARPAVARLENLSIAAAESLMEAELARGCHADVVGDLEALVDAHPLNERLRSQLMLALYRSGRQADALAHYQQARNALIDELGIEPGPALRNLEAEILRQDTALDAAAAPADASTVRRSPDTGPSITWRDGHVALQPRTATVGRRSDRDVVVADLDVSRVHAELRWDGTGYVLVDLGSTNGTLVNGRPITAQRLHSGDSITVGTTILRFHDPAEASTGAGPAQPGGSAGVGSSGSPNT